KPQNVLVTRSGSAKLTDFGIARGAVESSLTETGMALGTAAYMAPEQASGKPVGPGVDLYAAGVILFELVTGRLPFPGENPVQVMYQQVHEAVPLPGELNRAIPAELEGVILRALAKEPGERYPTAEAMAEALAGVGSSEATRVLTAVPAGHVDRKMPDNRAYQDVPPARSVQAPARSRGSLPRAAAWVVGILVAFSLAGLILLDPFPSGGDNPNVGETAPSNSPAVLSTTPSPSPSPSLAPSPTPEPSPTPSPTASPEDEAPVASPVPPSPSVEPDDAFPDPSAIETHLLERKDEIRSRIAEEIGDSQPQYSPAP
ncbi:MAG TPA: protein kinase, partial [Nitrolancea sp.]|nr:protein kinase [Nitrolancea sp.]